MIPEKKSYRDGMSSADINQLTDYKGHSHHFNFTNPRWYTEGRKLLFGSDRNNLFGVDIETGEIEQLTDLEPVPLPRISPEGRCVVFTSDRSSYDNLYTVPLVDFESQPLADQ